MIADLFQFACIFHESGCALRRCKCKWLFRSLRQNAVDKPLMKRAVLELLLQENVLSSSLFFFSFEDFSFFVLPQNH